MHVAPFLFCTKQIESFKITRNQIQGLISAVTLVGNELTIKSNFDEQLTNKYVYIADDEAFWMTQEPIAFTKDENGVPTMTVKVGGGIEFNEQKTYIVHMGLVTDEGSGLTTREHIGSYQNYDAVNLNILKHYKTQSLKPTDEQGGFTSRDYYRRLDDLVRSITKDYISGNSEYESYYQFVLDEILENMTEFTVDKVNETVDKVEKDLADTINQFNTATTEIVKLYRDDHYSYASDEWLRSDVTQEEIDTVKALVEALPEKADKKSIVDDMNYISYLFSQKQSELPKNASKAMDTFGALKYLFNEEEQNVSSVVSVPSME